MMELVKIDWWRFAGICLTVFAAIILQLSFLHWLGFSLEFVLASLIAASFFLSLKEFLPLMLGSMLLFIWQNAVGFEIALIPITLLPFLGKKIFSWDGWISNMVFLGISIITFHLVLHLGIIYKNLPLFFGDFAGSLIFGSILFFVFRFVYDGVR